MELFVGFVGGFLTGVVLVLSIFYYRIMAQEMK